METNGASLEAGVTAAMHRAQDSLREQYQACEESVRKSPGSSVLIAAVAGYLFRNLAIGALLGGLIRLTLALLRPALFLYVAAKGYELVQRGTQVAAASVSAPEPGNLEKAPSRRTQRASRD